jgi:hypothetical protein
MLSTNELSEIRRRLKNNYIKMKLQYTVSFRLTWEQYESANFDHICHNIQYRRKNGMKLSVFDPNNIDSDLI